jgi:uncharacterized iron-regulated protein
MHWPQQFTSWLRDACLYLCVISMLHSGAASGAVHSRPVSRPVANGSISLTQPQANLLQKLRGADIIYLGETHDRLVDHQAQLTLIEALHRHNPQLVIGMEMFQRPYQSALDAYLRGTIDEETMLATTEYRQRWRFDWSLYAPIVQFAKAHSFPILALNAPTEIVRQVAREGLVALKPDTPHIPPLAEIDTSNTVYRQRLLKLYESFHQGQGNSAGFERFFQAQILWDETMAEVIAQYWLKHPERQIVVLVGEGHVLYGEGIPQRVARRLKQSGRNDWRQSIGIMHPSPEVQAAGTRAADFFWDILPQP